MFGVGGWLRPSSKFRHERSFTLSQPLSLSLSLFRSLCLSLDFSPFKTDSSKRTDVLNIPYAISYANTLMSWSCVSESPPAGRDYPRQIMNKVRENENDFSNLLISWGNITRWMRIEDSTNYIMTCFADIETIEAFRLWDFSLDLLKKYFSRPIVLIMHCTWENLAFEFLTYCRLTSRTQYTPRYRSSIMKRHRDFSVSARTFHFFVNF